jgi:hypothetical protein
VLEKQFIQLLHNNYFESNTVKGMILYPKCLIGDGNIFRHKELINYISFLEHELYKNKQEQQ